MILIYVFNMDGIVHQAFLLIQGYMEEIEVAGDII